MLKARILLLLFVSSSCASLVSKSTYPIQIGVNPPGANVVITQHSKKNGDKVIYEGQAPCIAVLSASEGYFKKSSYTLELSADDRQSKKIPLTFGVDGWYWGNIFLGGLIGWLIVDPATGAMYAPHQKVILETLGKNNSTSRAEIHFKSLNEIDSELRKSIVLIK